MMTRDDITTIWW